MHPEIKEFWERCGHEIEAGADNFFFIKGKYPAAYFSEPEVVSEYKWQYYYHDHNKWYYEKDMLRLVRLKAFL